MVLCLLALSIFYWRVFPTCFVDGTGLTAFKVASEYTIVMILLAAIYLLRQRRHQFDRRIFILLTASMAVTIVSELAFTLYTDAYGIANAIGHYFKIVSFYLIYKAVIESGLEKPYTVLFKNLKDNEEALRHERDFAQSLINTAQTIILTLDTEGRIISFNPYMEEISGYRLEEVRGKDWVTTFLPKRNQEKTKEIFLAAISDIQTKGNIDTIVTRDGQERDIEWYDKTLKDSSGNVVGLLGIGRDITERKQAEETLYREKLLSDSVVDNTPAGILFLDNDFVLRRYNHTAAEFLRTYTPYTGEQALGMSYFNIAAGSRPQVEEWFQKVRDTGQVDTRYGFQLVLKHDGQEKITYWDTSVAPVLDTEGKTKGILILTQDVTEHRLAEEALLSSEKKLRLMFESVTDGIAVTDLNGVITDANKRVAEMHGFGSVEDILGRNASELIAPHDRKKAAANMQRTFEDGTFQGFEYTLLRSDGSEFSGEVSASVIKDYSNNPIGYIAITRDITERKQAEEALRESEEKFRGLIETTSDFIWEMDVNGVYTYCSPQIEKLWGLEPEEMLGKTPFDLFLPEDREQAIKAFSMLLESSSPFMNMEMRSLDGTGRTVLIEVSGVPFYDVDGRLNGYRGISRDITERKQAEEALAQSRERLHDLSIHQRTMREEERTNIAREIHDELGQALTALKMDASWLSKRLPKEQESLLEKTETMTELIDSTIQNVKRISTELRPGILDDFGLLAAMEWQAEEFQKRTGIKCTVKAESEVELNEEHNTALFRIFQEALTNSARHTSATKVTATLKSQDGKMVMRIRDNGQGITQEQIFSSRSFGIIGIRERANDIGGKLSIRGNPGKGTTVTVTIPLVKNGEAQ